MKKFYSFLLLFALLIGAGNVWGEQSLPYNYGFEDYNLATDGWTTQNPSGKNSSEFTIAGAAKKTGSYGFRFSSYSDQGVNTQYLISPELNAPTGVELTFAYKASSTSGTEVFKVGYSTTDASISSFVFGDEISTKSTSWKTYEGSFPAGTKYIAVYYYANYQYRLYVDDFTFEAGSASATCPVPTALTKGTITATSATFTWTAGGEESSWQYLCLPAAESPNWESSAVETVNNSSATVSVLPSTAYKFYVRAYCAADDQSGDVSVAFATPCEAATSIASYGFEDVTTGSGVYDIPSCWSRVAYESSYYGTLPYVVNGSSSAHGGNKYLYFYGGSSTTSSIIVLPSISSPNTKAISFWYKNNYESASYGKLQIGCMTDPTDASTFNVLPNGTLGQVTEYTQVDGFSLSGMSPTGYIAIRFIGGSSAYGAAYVDDIEVFTPSSCTKPTGLTASASSPVSANVSWTAGGSETAWDLQYRVKGTSAWTAVTNLTTASHSISGLAGNTTYEIQVQANCGGEQSGWTASAEVHTPCAAVTSFPWTEDFTGMASEIIPDCWDNSASTCTPAWDNTEYYIWGTYASSDNTMLRLYSAYINADGVAVINSPLITIPNENDFEFLFDYSHKANCGAFTLKVSVDGAPFAELGSYTNGAGTTSTYPGAWITESISLASFANHTIQFQFSANPNYGNGAIFLDNFKVQKAPTCFKPTGLGVSNITSATADLAWTAGASETAWVVQYKEESASDWTEKAVSTTPSCSLTGLSANTTYYVQVKSDCGASDYSEPTAQQTFKTTCSEESLPFQEDFGNTVPDCWNVGKTGGTYQWAPNYDTYPDYYLQFRTSSGSTYSYLTLPAIVLTEDAQLTFDWRNSNNVTADLLISTDGGATFTTIPNHGLSTTASSWTSKKYNLSAYTGETVIISFRGYNGAASRYLRINNIRVEAIPCEALAAPTAAPTEDGGTISWTGNAKALRYQAVGASSWNTVVVNTNSYLLTGLETSTSYNVQVQAACASGDDDIWSPSLTFATRCAASDVLPYNNNFDAEESNEMPACWSRISTTDYPYVYSGSAAYGGTGKFLYFQGNTEQIAVLPALTAEMNTLTLSLYYKGSNATFQLGYIEADGVTFHALETLPILTAYADNPYELDMADAPPSAKYIAIRYTNTSSSGAGYVDNVVVDKTPTCFKPASIAAATDVTATNATIAWTASGKGETQYQYICVPVGETPDWNAAELTSELSATLTTLAPTTEYTFYVRSYCGTEDQSNPVSVSFTTKCGAAAMPFGENFNAVADYDMPECWNVFAATYYAAYVANGQLQADAPKTNATVIVLPELEASFVGYSIAFNYRTTNGTLEVGYVTDANDKNTFVPVSEALTASATTQAVVPFTAGSGNIALRFTGNTSDGDLYLDDILVLRSVTLADNEDNSAVLASLNGQTVNATINRTIYCDGDYNTICLPFSLATLEGTPLEGATVYAYKYAVIEPDELQVRIYESENGIQAGVPYLLKKSDSDNLTSMTFTGVTITAAAGKSIGAEEPVSFIGILKPQPFVAGDESTLFVSTANNLAWASEDSNLKSFRAYFKRNDNSAGAPLRPGMRARIVLQEQVATGVDNTSGNTGECFKLIENEQLVIIRNGVKYNVQGQVIR